MNCSNCNLVNLNSGTYETEEIMCENGHFLCAKCYATSKTRCIQCERRLFDYGNWTLDMIYNSIKLNEKPTRYSSDSCDGESDALKDAVSTKLLFSRPKSLDGESVDNSYDLNFLNSKGNQTCATSNQNPNEISIQNAYFEGQNLNYCENFEQIQSKSDLVKKDTRQNLVDQMTEEIRRKIKEEIHNSFKNDPRTLIKPDEYVCVKQCNTIGVSTESEPMFLPKFQSYKGAKEHVVQVIDLNQNKHTEVPQDYLVMNSDTRHNINPEILETVNGKKSSSVVDEKIQQVIGTVQESGENPIPTISEDKHFFNMLREKFSKIPPNKIEQIISSICSADGSNNSNQDANQCRSGLGLEQTKNDFPLISNSSRASYSPPSCYQIAAIPNPQFQLITTASRPLLKTVDATTLHIPRSPVICPISSCRQACFVSDFTRHIAVDHTNVPMERILPRQCKNFFLDPKLIHFGSNRCQILLLVKDKIRNLGHEKFKDFIPVLVMSTKVSTLELCCTKSEPINAQTKNLTGGFLMIWLTGLMPPQVPIFFSLTVWARTGNMPSCHIVHSGQLYSIRNSQNASIIQESGQKLLLSQNQVSLLTNNGRNMLELQIVIN